MQNNTAHLYEIRDAVAALCAEYGEDYWKELDAEKEYPTEFIDEMTQAGFLNVLIPEEYGGPGLGLQEACVILEEVSFQGAQASACRAQMHIMDAILRHGTRRQKRRYLSRIAAGKIRLQSFGVTEPNAGTDTANLRTVARKVGDRYVINGQKVWISRIEYSDLMILLARTTPRGECRKKTDGLSAFIVDLNDAVGAGLDVQPIDAMINHHACELTFDDLEIPEENLLGKQDQGFRIVLDGMNAERILVASECIGDARYFINKATAYAKERIVFGRPVGANQGVQFPLARSFAETEAAGLMMEKAARKYDVGEPCGGEANMAKMLAAEASWKAGDIAMQTFGGFAFSREYHLERKFRETRLHQVAPISTNMILSYIAENILDLPRSF